MPLTRAFTPGCHSEPIMRASSLSIRCTLALVACLAGSGIAAGAEPGQPQAQPAQQVAGAQSKPERTGEQIYMAACAACHAPDGKGQPQSVLGFEPPATFPDFSDCAVGTAENDYIWLAVVHGGGHARAQSHIMPAFAD